MHFIQPSQEDYSPYQPINSFGRNLEQLQDRGTLTKAQLRENEHSLLAQNSYRDRHEWGLQPSPMSVATILPVQISGTQQGPMIASECVLQLTSPPVNALRDTSETLEGYPSFRSTRGSIDSNPVASVSSFSSLSSISHHQQSVHSQGPYPSGDTLYATWRGPLSSTEYAVSSSDNQHELTAYRWHWDNPTSLQDWQGHGMLPLCDRCTHRLAARQVWLPPVHKQPVQQHYQQ